MSEPSNQRFKISEKFVLLICLMLAFSLVDFVVAEEVAPNFTLRDIDGVLFSLNDFRGKVVFIDFFATWCGSCRAGIPTLRVLHEEFGEDLVIISISVDSFSDTVEGLKQFREDYDMNWIIALDTMGVSLNYGVTHIPTKVIIDQEGYITHRHVGLVGEAALREEIQGIVPEFSLLILPLIMIFTLAVILWKKRFKGNSESEKLGSTVNLYVQAHVHA
ncbi:MAG: TlpA disulfide reductase family protein [Candidatus Bathyarchaeota archaeon]|jgi:thiol-disulfide isomerase/thioredoxin